MPQLNESYRNDKMNSREINSIVAWFDHAVSNAEDTTAEELEEFRRKLASQLSFTPGIYYDFLNKMMMNNADPERNKASSYLETTTLDTHMDKVLRSAGTTTVKPLLEGLGQVVAGLSFGRYGIYDLQRAEDVHKYQKETNEELTNEEEMEKGDDFEKEFKKHAVEIHSPNIDKNKLAYLKNRRADKEAFAEYLQNMRNTDPAKADYLASESALWEKENQKLDNVALNLFDTKHQIEMLKIKQNQNAYEFTKKDQKALEKAKKQEKSLNKKADKLREDMRKNYEKRLKKNPSSYADVVENRKMQISFGDLRYMNRVEAQANVKQERISRPLDLQAHFGSNRVHEQKNAEKQLQMQNQRSQNEKTQNQKSDPVVGDD